MRKSYTRDVTPLNICRMLTMVNYPPSARAEGGLSTLAAAPADLNTHGSNYKGVLTTRKTTPCTPSKGGKCSVAITLLVSCFLLLVCPSLHAQLFEFSTKDAERLKGRTAVFILPDLKSSTNTRAYDTARISTQKYWIDHLQSWWEKGARKGWSSSLPLIFVEKSSIDSLPKNRLYLFMEVTSLTNFEYSWQYMMKSDSAILYRDRKAFQDNQKFGYMTLKYSDRNEPFYTWYFFTLIPTQLDMYEAMKSVCTIVQRSIVNSKSKTKNIEDEIRSRNATLKSRTLLMDSSVVNKSFKTFSYIPEEYKEPYQLTSHSTLEKRIMSGDESGAVFFMVPIKDPIGRGESYVGTSGGGMGVYDKTYFFMQMILDLGTGNFLYYDKCEEPRVLVKDWKRFTRYTDEDPTK